jgi:hypothetical protein
MYMAPIIHHVGFCCCCSLLLPLGLMMLHPRAYVFYYVPAYYYSIILRRYSGSTSSSRWWWLVVAGGGGQCGVRLYSVYTIHRYTCVRVWRGAWWAGQRAAAHQWWASYKVRIAQLFIVFITTTTWWEGACLSPACLPAALVAASGRQRDGTYFDPSTSDGSFAAGHTNTHTTRHAPPNRAWRGAFEWRCAPVVCPRHDYYHYVAGYRDV